MSQSYTLSQLVRSVQQCLHTYFSGNYWIRAESSDFSQRANGYCYLDLIEKAPNEERLLAQMRALIFPSDAVSICSRFKAISGQDLASGLQLLCLCRLQHHPVYGLSLRIIDIDPSYTMGDQARCRLEVIKKLKEEGLFDLNKALAMPRPLRRIAIISSATAAGYQDFIKQIEQNSLADTFYLRLFAATMQGEQSEGSVIAALKRIEQSRELFDAVAIIRGGGASIDLAAFDSLEMARACARFPLPILTGIGHDRDESVLDLIAHKALKTPTALANYLIDLHRGEQELLESLRQRAVAGLELILANQYRRLDMLSSKMPLLLMDGLRRQEKMLADYEKSIKEGLARQLAYEQNRLMSLVWHLPSAVRLLTERQFELLGRYSEAMRRLPKSILQEQKLLQELSARFEWRLRVQSQAERSRLLTLGERVAALLKHRSETAARDLQILEQRLRQATAKRSDTSRRELASLEQALRLLHPANTLKRGYSIVRRGNELIRSAKDLRKGDRISSQFYDGFVDSELL